MVPPIVAVIGGLSAITVASIVNSPPVDAAGAARPTPTTTTSAPTPVDVEGINLDRADDLEATELSFDCTGWGDVIVMVTEAASAEPVPVKLCSAPETTTTTTTP